MDISGVPLEKVKVLAGPHAVHVYAEGHPPLVLTHAQLHFLWLQAVEARAEAISDLAGGKPGGGGQD